MTPSSKVLLVDDHAALRLGIRKALAGGEFNVVAEAADGDEALRALELRPQIAVVDMMLPLTTGEQLTRRLLEADPHLKVLIFSMREDRWLVQQALRAGARGYVSKRSSLSELLDAVRQIADGRTFLDHRLETGGRYQTERGPESTPLSERETIVLRLTALGHDRYEIAERLGVSPRTLETYRSRGMHKLLLRSRADLMSFAAACGWLQEESEV